MQARARREWDEAFDVAIAASEVREATEVLGDAAPDLLRQGRTRTVEKWLELIGGAASTSPAASLARVELLTREGRLADARFLARNVTASIPDDDALMSRGLFLLGQTEHLASNYKQALDLHDRALTMATDENDYRNALWGAFLSVAELETGGLHDYVREIERTAPRDADGQLRVASAHQIAAAREGSFKGVWSRLRPLVGMVDQAIDPMAKTNFLAGASYLNIGRAHYETACSLAGRALAACREFRLDFAVGYCLVLRGAAEAGMRDFRAAEQTLLEAERYAREHEDPHLRLEVSILELKIRLLRGVPDSGTDVREIVPPGAHGEYLALRAIGAAADGDFGQALSLVAEAQRLTRTVPAALYGRMAEGIVAVREDRPDAGASIVEAVATAAAADFLDAGVVALRAYPPMTDVLVSSQTGRDLPKFVVEGLPELARLRGQKRKAGASTNAFGLTPREAEVLGLMREGLSNADIARRLVISTSTAKVHVHHVLEKMRASTRIEVILKTSRDD